MAIAGLVADIGGTNVRFALVNRYGATEQIQNMLCRDYSGPVEAVEAYLDRLHLAQKPRRAAFCMAGPIKGDALKITNNHWAFSKSAVQSALGLDHLTILNDFTAVALSAPRLTSNDCLTVGGGQISEGPIVVLGPGTGLGVSGLIADDKGQCLPISGEGGHVTLAAVNEQEDKILAQLRKDVGFVSAEQVLSGFGMVNLYNAMRVIAGLERQSLEPEQITDMAQQGDELANQVLDQFCAFLGTVASDMALTLYATGGVYIAGGIIPRIGKRFIQSPFRQRFDDKGIYQSFMRDIPTQVVTHSHPAFVGLTAKIMTN